MNINRRARGFVDSRNKKVDFYSGEYHYATHNE